MSINNYVKTEELPWIQDDLQSIKVQNIGISLYPANKKILKPKALKSTKSEGKKIKFENEDLVIKSYRKLNFCISDYLKPKRDHSSQKINNQRESFRPVKTVQLQRQQQSTPQVKPQAVRVILPQVEQHTKRSKMQSTSRSSPKKQMEKSFWKSSWKNFDASEKSIKDGRMDHFNSIMSVQEQEISAGFNTTLFSNLTFPKKGLQHQSKIPTKNKQHLDKNLGLAVKFKTDEKWQNYSYEERRRKQELARVLSKREQACNQMEKNELSVEMAYKILNTTFINENLDQEKAEAGARVIVQKIANPEGQDLALMMEHALQNQGKLCDLGNFSSRNDSLIETENSAFLTLVAKEKQIKENREKLEIQLVNNMKEVVPELPPQVKYVTQIDKYIDDLRLELRNNNTVDIMDSLNQTQQLPRLDTFKFTSNTSHKQLRSPLYDQVKRHQQRIDDLQNKFQSLNSVKKPKIVKKGVVFKIKQEKCEENEEKSKDQLQKFDAIEDLLNQMKKFRQENEIKKGRATFVKAPEIIVNDEVVYLNENVNSPLKYMSKVQVLKYREDQLDVDVEKQRHSTQVLRNHELRAFLNRHEQLIERVMEKITQEINQEKEIPQGQIMEQEENKRRQKKSVSNLEIRKKSAVIDFRKTTLEPRRAEIDMKQMYSKWLFEFFTQPVDQSKEKNQMKTYLIKRLGKFASKNSHVSSIPKIENCKKITSFYGKWYLKPNQFNSTMNLYKNKLLSNKINELEISQELSQIESAQNWIKNGTI